MTGFCKIKRRHHKTLKPSGRNNQLQGKLFTDECGTFSSTTPCLVDERSTVFIHFAFSHGCNLSGAFTFCKAFVVCLRSSQGFGAQTPAREARVSGTARMAYIQSGMLLHRLTSPLLRLCSDIFFFPSLGTSPVEIFCCSKDGSVSSENSTGGHSIRCSVASSHMSLSQSPPSGA